MEVRDAQVEIQRLREKVALLEEELAILVRLLSSWVFGRQLDRQQSGNSRVQLANVEVQQLLKDPGDEETGEFLHHFVVFLLVQQWSKDPVEGKDASASADAGGVGLKTTPEEILQPGLTKVEIARYGRQLILPEIGVEGQTKLKNTAVLVVGAGGLGAPVIMYLASCGIGLQLSFYSCLSFLFVLLF